MRDNDVIDVEVKKESLPNADHCDICGQISTRSLLIGEMQNSYGTDYELCLSINCEEEAIEKYIEELCYAGR